MKVARSKSIDCMILYLENPRKHTLIYKEKADRWLLGVREGETGGVKALPSSLDSHETIQVGVQLTDLLTVTSAGELCKCLGQREREWIISPGGLHIISGT